MRIVLAIDPGNVESAWVTMDMDAQKPISHGKVNNAELEKMLIERVLIFDEAAIEVVSGYGLPEGHGRASGKMLGGVFETESGTRGGPAMSVIVKGMEMPDGCENCLLRYRSQGAYCTDRCYATVAHKNIDPWTFGRTRNGDKPDWCPLRPLPDKHGRLIEADSLKETLDYYIREAGWDEKTNQVLGWVKDEFIDSEPTIVKAEGE